MKKIQNKGIFAMLFTLMGLAAWLLYRQMYASFMDERGLLVAWSVPEVLILVLMACALVGAFVVSHGSAMGQPNRILSAVGDLVFAGGVTSLFFDNVYSWEQVSNALNRLQNGYGRVANGRMRDIMLIVTSAIAALAVLSLVVSCVRKLMNKQAIFLLNLLPFVVCALMLVECYQLWSELPQMMDYVPALGAVLSLGLTAFHRMERASGLPFKSRHAGFGLLTVFFCCASLGQGDFTLFLAAAAVWTLTDLSALQAAPAEKA